MWQLILDFLQANWFKISLVVWMFYLVSGFGREWFKHQIEWVKGLFIDDDDIAHPNAPNHKNAILIALTVVFIIAFLRKIALSNTPDIPDMPAGWQLVILAGLGIAAAKTGVQKLFENKWGSNNNNNNGDRTDDKTAQK